VSQPTGGSLDPQGPVAETMADLWWLMLALGGAVFVLVVALLVVGLFRKRRSSESEPLSDAAVSRAWLVGGGIVLPVVVLIAILIATVAAMRDTGKDAQAEALVVEVIGHQWWWEIRYPEAGFTTANELHIPVGRPVALRLTSEDVIHSFWVPRLAGKIDMLPDGVNTLILQADEPGVHDSKCAEFCGLQHAQMDLVLVAEPTDRFNAWISAQSQPASAPTGALARRGADLLVEGDCSLCHTVRGTPADGVTGPDLTHVAGRPAIGAGAVPNTPANLKRWIRNPHVIKEGVKMPASDLTEQELDAVVAYLETLE
jgi:cytochrome c oxidase subunit II